MYKEKKGKAEIVPGHLFERKKAHAVPTKINQRAVERSEERRMDKAGLVNDKRDWVMQHCCFYGTCGSSSSSSSVFTFFLLLSFIILVLCHSCIGCTLLLLCLILLRCYPCLHFPFLAANASDVVLALSGGVDSVFTMHGKKTFLLLRIALLLEGCPNLLFFYFFFLNKTDFILRGVFSILT